MFDEPPVPGYGAGGRAAVADLIGAIRDGRATEAPIDALVRTLEVIDAAYESARTSRHVSVPQARGGTNDAEPGSRVHRRQCPGRPDDRWRARCPDRRRPR